MTARELFNLRARQQKELQAAKEMLEREQSRKEARAKKAALRAQAIAEEKAQRKREVAARQASATPPGYAIVAHLARERGLTESAIYRAIKVGNIPSERIGSYRYVSIAGYDEWHARAMEHRKEYARRGGDTTKGKSLERLAIAQSLAPDTPISITEFQRITGVSLSAVYRAIRLGKLETIKDGHNRYILPRAYEAYRESSKVNRGLAARKAIEVRKRKCAERRKAA